MNGRIDKQLVCRRFRRALPTYRRSAEVQERMAERLLAIIERAGALRVPEARVLEFGCGSAMLTSLLFGRTSPAAFFANDLVAESRAFVEAAVQGRPPARLEFLPGDIESIDPLPSALDLVLSNATVQWLHDPALFFEKLAAAVRPGGIVAFSTFGTENMREIARLGEASLSYRSLDEVAALAGESFEVIGLEEEFQYQQFDSPEAVLRHIRDTGVNGVSKRAWSRSRYLDFLHRYRAEYSNGAGVSLTWHPVYCCFRRRADS